MLRGHEGCVLNALCSRPQDSPATRTVGPVSMTGKFTEYICPFNFSQHIGLLLLYSEVLMEMSVSGPLVPIVKNNLVFTRCPSV